jgi:hypothetical protein
VIFHSYVKLPEGNIGNHQTSRVLIVGFTTLTPVLLRRNSDLPGVQVGMVSAGLPRPLNDEVMAIA